MRVRGNKDGDNRKVLTMKKNKCGRRPRCGQAMTHKISVRISDPEYHALRARAGKRIVAELVREKLSDILSV